MSARGAANLAICGARSRSGRARIFAITSSYRAPARNIGCAAPFGQDRTHETCDVIAFCIGAGRCHANTVDIPGVNFALEQFGRRDGKDAGASAKIEDGARTPRSRDSLQHE